MAEHPRLSAILAMSPEGDIGLDGKLPWGKLPRDMRRFRDFTARPDTICVVGRATWHGLPRLAERRFIVLSRKYAGSTLPQGDSPAILSVAASLSSAVTYAERFGAREIMVIGGRQVYMEALPHLDRILLTVVHGKFKADANVGLMEHFLHWHKKIDGESFDPDALTPYRLSFSEWVRK